jgi:hypothetical protein
VIDREKFIETFWEICDERDLYLYSMTNTEVDLLLCETIDRIEKIDEQVRKIIEKGDECAEAKSRC